MMLALIEYFWAFTWQNKQKHWANTSKITTTEFYLNLPLVRKLIFQGDVPGTIPSSGRVAKLYYQNWI